MTSINQLKWSENLFPQMEFPLCRIFTCFQPGAMYAVLFILPLVIRRRSPLGIIYAHKKDAVSQETFNVLE